MLCLRLDVENQSCHAGDDPRGIASKTHVRNHFNAHFRQKFFGREGGWRPPSPPEPPLPPPYPYCLSTPVLDPGPAALTRRRAGASPSRIPPVSPLLTERAGHFKMKPQLERPVGACPVRRAHGTLQKLPSPPASIRPTQNRSKPLPSAPPLRLNKSAPPFRLNNPLRQFRCTNQPRHSA
jgi:hypothetical protein